MAYKKVTYGKSQLKRIPTYEGESIEQKLERILSNKEPITDGAPEIYTERKDGAQAQFNIRTDRWEVAAEAMDLVQKNVEAKRDAKAAKKEVEKEAKVVKLKPKENGGAESTNGTSDA